MAKEVELGSSLARARVYAGSSWPGWGYKSACVARGEHW